MQFLIVSRRKSQEFFSTASFFFVLYMIAYQSALIPRKLLCSKKFLVTRLGWLLLLISFALVNIYLYMEQKQLSSHTKFKKKRASALHTVFFCAFIFKNQTARKTVDELGFIAKHKLNQTKSLNIQITTSRILNSFRSTLHIAGKKSYTPFMGSKNTLVSI